MSAQTKIFMDRCFALPAYQSDPFKDKRIAIAMTYGDENPFSSGCVNALRTFQDAFRYTNPILSAWSMEVQWMPARFSPIKSHERGFEFGKEACVRVNPVRY